MKTGSLPREMIPGYSAECANKDAAELHSALLLHFFYV